MEFKTIVQDRGGIIRLGNSLNIDSSRQERTDARAEAVAWVANALNDFSFERKIKTETEKLKPQIKIKLLPKSGVLLCVIYTQSVDFSYKSFDNMFIADVGMDYKIVLNRYQDTPKMGAAVHSAFMKKEMFIWVTE